MEDDASNRVKLVDDTTKMIDMHFSLLQSVFYTTSYEHEVNVAIFGAKC